MRHPLTARYFIRKYAASLLPVVVPLIVLGAVSVYITDNFFEREIVTATSRQIESLKDTLDQTVFDLDALNLAFGSNASIISSVDALLSTDSVTVEDALLARMITDLLNAQINARPYVESVYLYLDRYPDKLFTTDMGVVSVADYPDTGWIGTYKATPQSYVLWTQSRRVRLAPFERHPHDYFTMYHRLFPAVTGRTGVIVMNLDETYVRQLVEQAALYPDQEVDLIGRNGNLLLTTNATATIGGLARSLRSTDTNGLVKRFFEGREYYAYSSQTTRYGWRIITVIPTIRLNRIRTVIRTAMLFLLAISLIIGALLTFSLVRRNVRRVSTVTDLFQRADSDEETIEAPAPGNDEFDFMVETLIRTFLKQKYARLQLSERKARAENLELRALRAQINPHFLFNSLESLYWEAYGPEEMPSPASTMIKDLAVLLRYSLQDSDEVFLSDEIEIARRYLAIQKLRYGDRFEVVWKLAPQSTRVRMLKFVLQPLLENAIYHGIKEREGRGTIQISSWFVDSTLVLSVWDDGPGIVAERLKEVRESLDEASHSAEHIGLYNTNRRIQLTFGAEYGLSITSQPGKGTEVKIRLPGISGSDQK